MGINTAPERPVLVPGEARLFSVSFDEVLDSGESMTGTPTVAEQTTSDLTITNEAVNTSTLTIKGNSVAAGRAVQFLVSGHLAANSPYKLKITVATDSTPAQTIVRHVQFLVQAE